MLEFGSTHKTALVRNMVKILLRTNPDERLHSILEKSLRLGLSSLTEDENSYLIENMPGDIYPPAPNANYSHLVHQLSWEFLRRNHEYQEFVKPFTSGEGNYPIALDFFHADQHKIFELNSRFWLLSPVNPAVPGRDFLYHYWHADYVHITDRVEYNMGQNSILEQPGPAGRSLREILRTSGRAAGSTYVEDSPSLQISLPQNLSKKEKIKRAVEILEQTLPDSPNEINDFGRFKEYLAALDLKNEGKNYNDIGFHLLGRNFEKKSKEAWNKGENCFSQGKKYLSDFKNLLKLDKGIFQNTNLFFDVRSEPDYLTKYRSL